jgi:cytochrome c oxidase cbb3-type subunit 3
MRRSLLIVTSIAADMAADVDTKVKLPAGRADLAIGEKLFESQCSRCHGPKGVGGRGPVLTRAKLSHAPDDKALVKVITDGIRGSEMPGAGAMSDHEVLQTAAYVRSLGKVPPAVVPGDAAHGSEIYHGKGNCTACHAINGEGGIAGPDLAGIGGSRSAAYLRESLLEPGAAVPEGYLLVTVAARNGPTVTGIRVNEDSFSIQLRDSAGRSYSFWKSDIEKLDKQKGKSPMPSYKGQLAEPELTDLVAYLASLKEAK